MNDKLSNNLINLLKSARGLAEPSFDVEMRITNWPERVSAETKKLAELLQTSGSDTELRACADILNSYAPSDVPEGLLRMLSRAVFDNPNTPLHDN